MNVRGRLFSLVIGLSFLGGIAVPGAYGVSKFFSASGDETSWGVSGNWVPAGVPALGDDVTLDQNGLAVTTAQDFSVRSVTVGGKAASSWRVEDFVSGGIVPPVADDPAILIRKGGRVLVQGSGTVRMRGPLKNTEEELPSEPSVMILLE